MDRSDTIKLISSTKTKNKYGVYEETHTAREVFCNVQSVTQSEFFEGGRNGLNPEYRFTMFGPDYEDETIVEYKGRTYTVYRTYITRNDMIELYVERRGGTNGIETDSD